MSTIIDTIKYWSEDYIKNLEIIPREAYLDYKIDKHFATAYIGIRRSGKTFIALNKALSQNEKFFYINFEDTFFINNNEPEIIDKLLEFYVEIYSKEPSILIFDEIQNINHWERALRKYIDSKQYKIIVTGSSAKLLSSELSTSLSGRAIEKKVWPLSFKEYLRFKGINKSPTEKEYLSLLKQYFTRGGFPAIVLEKDHIKQDEILSQYLNDILYKDIVSRYQIRNVPVFNKIVQYYLTNISSLHTFNKIKNAFLIQSETVQDYSAFCENAFLLFFVKKYDLNLKVQSRSPMKVYCIDPGLRNIKSMSEDIGKIAENIVFIELKRLGKEIFYHKEKHEVDFLCVEKNKPTEIIQVTYSNLENESTYEREVNGALEAMNKYKLNRSLILTKNYRDIKKIKNKKVVFKPIYEFLTYPN